MTPKRTKDVCSEESCHKPVALFTTSEGGDPFTLAEFELSNRDAPVPALVLAMHVLGVGQHVTWNGGAHGTTIITRTQ